MTAVSEIQVRHLASNSGSLDRIASIVCDEVAKLDTGGSPPAFGVHFASSGPQSFYATVHCVKLLVRYEQEIRQQGETRVLRGVFRARLDEPVKADRTVISSFSFGTNGETESTGDVIRPLIRGEFGDLSIKHNLALLLAHDVQRYLQAHTVQK